MDIPEPPPCPPKLKSHLNTLGQSIRTAQPIAGSYITVSEHSGQGTVINVDVSTLANTLKQSGGGGGSSGPGIPPPPSSGTWVLGAIDGVVQWIDTDTCS